MRNWKAIVLVVTLVGCGDDDPPPPDTDVQLDPLNEGGFQFETEPFDVPAGEEIQDCYFVEMPDLNGDGSDVWVDKIRIGVNGGSHHTNIFRVNTIKELDGEPGTMVHNGECFKSPNWSDWPLVANNQLSNGEYYEWQLPTDVGMRFTVGEKLMIQTHYVNASTQVTPFRGKVVVDMYVPPTQPAMEMGTMFATQQSIEICQSQPEVEYTGSCKFPEGTNLQVGAANGHYHARGRLFEIWAWDGLTSSPQGEPFYSSVDWEEPDMSIYTDDPVAIPNAGGIMWTCSYEWMPPETPATCALLNELDTDGEDDCCYTFGPKVEANEHCNVFLYYWPKTDNVSCQ